MSVSFLQALNRRKKRSAYRVAKRNKGLRPRLVVCRSNKNIYAQIVDAAGNVLTSASSVAKGLKDKVKGKSGVETAAIVGEAIAKDATAKGIKEIAFDKGPYPYIGCVKELAESCRKHGLAF